MEIFKERSLTKALNRDKKACANVCYHVRREHTKNLVTETSNYDRKYDTMMDKLVAKTENHEQEHDGMVKEHGNKLVTKTPAHD